MSFLRTFKSDYVEVNVKRTSSYSVFKLGERGSGLRTRRKAQDFYDLRDENLNNGTLFEDPEFLPEDSSLFYSQKPERNYVWLRPGEICDNPQFFVDGYSRFDVQQGELGDCWLLAAVANLTLYRSLFFQVVPEDQGFGENYAGIFHFRFWYFGKWVEVVIDDKLPTYKGRLVNLYSAERNEFWSALLEKAYAKLHGSYEALKGGSTCEAMEDFTGGIKESYEMKATPPDLYKILLKGYERCSLMGCSIAANPDVLEQRTSQGLVRGHAYSITCVKYVDVETPNASGKVPLLRIRNPWGQDTEWNGAWSDQSPEWGLIPADKKEAWGIVPDSDGEFWISFQDFQKYFENVDICNLTPDSLRLDEMTHGRSKRWEMSTFEGQWVQGVTAGGCRNYLETFWHNPQYRITLRDVDDDDDGNQEPKCTVIIALMQKNRRSIKTFLGVDRLMIGFTLYQLHSPDRLPKPLDMQFFADNAYVKQSGDFINLREVSCRFRLPAGTYCVVPSTFEPNQEGDFLLRIFSESESKTVKYDDEVTADKVDERVEKQAPTAEEDKQLQQLQEVFLKLAGDDMEIDSEELKNVLDYSMRKETRNEGFPQEVCRSIVKLWDLDQSGNLGFEEFKNLWIEIRNWKWAFNMYDLDQSGALSGFELRQALNSAGYRINTNVLNLLMNRYGNGASEITFQYFILSIVKLKTAMELYRQKASRGNKLRLYTLEDWIEATIYA